MLTGLLKGFGLGNILDFAGNLISGRSNRRAHNRQLAQAQGQFDAQMDESIQRRVKDAQKAGIHPLFAMGASVGNSPTIGAPSNPTGSGVGDAISQLGQSLGITAKNKSEARLDEAQAAYYDALTAKAQSDSAAEGRDQLGAQGVDPEMVPANRPGAAAPLSEVVPSLVNPSVPGRPGVRAGTIPESIEFTTEDGTRLTIPNPDLGLDEISQVEYVRKKFALHLTNQLEDLAATFRLARYNRATVAALQRQLRALEYRSGRRRPSWAQWAQKTKQLIQGLINHDRRRR